MKLFNKLLGRQEAKPNIVAGPIGMDYLIHYKCGCWDAPGSHGKEWMPCPSHRDMTYAEWLQEAE